MPQEYKVVIADTSCFILLDKIKELSLLQKVFGQIITTREIANEFGKDFPDWVEVKEITDLHYLAVLELEIDKGEASAITLAIEFDSSLLIIDDRKGRKLAERLGLNYTGTLGVLLRAKERRIIPKIKPILEKIQLTNFRFSTIVFNEILQIAGE